MFLAIPCNQVAQPPSLSLVSCLTRSTSLAIGHLKRSCSTYAKTLCYSIVQSQVPLLSKPRILHLNHSDHLFPNLSTPCYHGHVTRHILLVLPAATNHILA